MKRPQLRSHPYLQGLHLLFRASGLGRVEGAGGKARLVLDPAMMAQWDRLNPTEQYFQLMEAWMRFGRAEMVGERGSPCGDLRLPCLQAWELLPEKGLRFGAETTQVVYFPGVGRDLYLLALMDLFGLMKVEPPRRPVTPWSPAALEHDPFGDAALRLIFASEFDPSPTDDLPRDEEEGTPGERRFGAWQPLFRPYFPEWRENLEVPESESREGEFLFWVSLGKVWRLIAMPADATLDDLVGWVLRSMKFDSDHLYEFTYRDRMGAEASAFHPEMDHGPWADQIALGTLPLEPGQTMGLKYDFGDTWRFIVRLERVDPPGGKATRPRILESHGEAPRQYPDWDE